MIRDWKVGNRYVLGQNDVIDADGFMVLEVPYLQTKKARNGRRVNREIPVMEQIENARLGAAAPDMRDALATLLLGGLNLSAKPGDRGFTEAALAISAGIAALNKAGRMVGASPLLECAAREVNGGEP